MIKVISGKEHAKTMRCPYCGSAVEFCDSAKVYRGKSYGPIYLCTRWPECTGRVGCHPGTESPLGTLANDATRAARHQAHKIFDRLYTEKHCTRGEAYTMLAKYFGVKVVHIGESDLERCREIIRFARRYLDL